MKRLTFLAIATVAITNSALAAYDNIYVSVGGGYVVNNRSFSTTAHSNTVLFQPTQLGTSLFLLPNINWKNKFHNGFEANAALGATFCQNWRGEGEFLIQNFRRKMNGSYDWNEIHPTTGVLFASQLNNPLRHTSNTVNTYALLANGYYDFKNNSKWTPSLGAGIGTAWVHSARTNTTNALVINDVTVPLMETVPTEEHSSLLTGMTLAWQAKAQLAYKLDCHFAVVGQYRLFGTTRLNSSSNSIVTSPNTAAASKFAAPGKRVKGLLSSGFDLNLQYTL